MTDKENFYAAMTAMYIVFAVITIVVCAINIATIVYYWKSYCRSTTHLLICNACVTLLYYALVNLVHLISHPTGDATRAQPTNTALCQFRAALLFSACIAAALSYLILAISRYFITILHKHRALLTFRTNWLLILSSWLISFVISAMMLISPVAYQYEPESRLCVLSTKVFHTSFPAVIVVFCLPLNIIVVLYLAILRQSTRQSQVQPNVFRMLRMKRNLKVFRNILISVTILTVGGTPSFFCIVLSKFTQVPWQLRPLALLSISLSASLNALALFFLNKQVRTLFFARIRCQRNPKPEQTMPIGHTIPQTAGISTSVV